MGEERKRNEERQEDVGGLNSSDLFDSVSTPRSPQPVRSLQRILWASGLGMYALRYSLIPSSTSELYLFNFGKVIRMSLIPCISVIK